MLALSLAFAGAALIWLAIQAGVLIGLSSVFRRHRTALVDDAVLPSAAVVMAVRGGDPELEATLRGLLDLDYPEFQIVVVVDGDSPDVWDCIHRVELDDHAGRLTAESLEYAEPTCSLKNSALVQAVERLQNEFDVVAFIDADAPPHRGWLRELVAPLLDENVGVSTGNRWYAPSEARWGSIVRYCWNVGAVAHMWLNKITWAGSMALRSDVLREIDLVEVWRKSLSTDSVIFERMKSHGYKVEFVPSVMMINREEIELFKFLGWVQRQMLGGWLYHPSGLIALGHTLAIVGIHLAALVLIGASLLANQWTPAAITAGALFTVWAGTAWASSLIEASVRGVIARRGEELEPMKLSMALQLPVALLFVQMVHPLNMAVVMTTRRVTWRDVSYEIVSPFEVRVLHHQPFRIECRAGSRESIV